MATANEVFVGIDVAQDELVVAIRPGEGVACFANDEAGHAALVTRLATHAPTLVVMEATGGLEQAVAVAVAEADLPVVIANPKQVRDFARGVGKLAKTDPIDAAILARFGEVVRPAPRPTTGEAGRALRALVLRRRQVRDRRVADRQRRSQSNPVVHPFLDRAIDAATEELADLDAAIAARVAAEPSWQATRTILESVPGVGPIVAATLVAELPELGTLGAKQVAALAGLAPRTRESGKRRGAATIGGGRRGVRCALYLAAVTGIRWNPTIAAFYAHLVAAGKPKKLALVAAARKLLSILNAMVRDGSLWDPPAIESAPTP